MMILLDNYQYQSTQVGGLGDVVTSLSRAVQDLGHKVEVILPKYDCLILSSVSFSIGVKYPAFLFFPYLSIC
jgi:glycogen synthase